MGILRGRFCSWKDLLRKIMNETKAGAKSKQARNEVMQAIRHAAISEFSQHGFAGASTQAIAERAGISKSGLHYYIEDKETLYAELIGELMEVWMKLVEFDDELDTPRDILARYIREKLTYSFENPELSRIFTTELLSGGHRLEAFWSGAISRTDSTIAVIHKWVRTGRIRDLDPRLLMMHLWAMTQYYADYAIQAERMLRKPLSDRKLQSHILAELVAFVLAGCGIEPAIHSARDHPLKLK
jgi:TetR/AcrR family transcriptional regulator